MKKTQICIICIASERNWLETFLLWSAIWQYSAEQNKAIDLEKLFIVHMAQGDIANNEFISHHTFECNMKTSQFLISTGEKTPLWLSLK